MVHNIVSLCIAFVDNLTLMMRVALVVGAIFLVQDLRIATERFRQLPPEIESTVAVHEAEPELIIEPEPQEPVLSDTVIHFLNCTYEDYRTVHYKECVEGQSRVYQRPQADDDTGYVTYDATVLLARLDNRTKL
jgi:hypothetical protein